MKVISLLQKPDGCQTILHAQSNCVLMFCIFIYINHIVFSLILLQFLIENSFTTDQCGTLALIEEPKLCKY